MLHAFSGPQEVFQGGCRHPSGDRWAAGGPTPLPFPFSPNEPIPVIVFLKENYGIRIFLIWPII